MAKAKKAKKAKVDPHVCYAVFSGGPRDGDSLRMVNPPPEFLRLAFPDWCTYERTDERMKDRATGQDQVIFTYWGEAPPPRKESLL